MAMNEVWTDVRESLNTPSGRQRVRDLVRASLGIAAIAFPSVRIAQAVLPLVRALLGSLGYRLVAVGPSDPQSQEVDIDWDDQRHASRAVAELRSGR